MHGLTDAYRHHHETAKAATEQSCVFRCHNLIVPSLVLEPVRNVSVMGAAEQLHVVL